MELVRICPACGQENPASELMCRECLCLIGNVTPTPRGAGEEASPARESARDSGDAMADAAGTVKMSRFLTLLDSSGEEVIVCESGAVLGRNGVGAEYLQNMPTVSRRHCQIDMGREGWQVRDCGSTNGTWVNGARIEGPTPLGAGDTLSLSQACSLKVKL